eukprot:2018119-Alexandrium_andersonii.AAC.1
MGRHTGQSHLGGSMMGDPLVAKLGANEGGNPSRPRGHDVDSKLLLCAVMRHAGADTRCGFISLKLRV